MKKLTTVFATAAVALAAVALLYVTGRSATAAPKDQPPEPNWQAFQLPVTTVDTGGLCADGLPKVRWVVDFDTTGWSEAHVWFFYPSGANTITLDGTLIFRSFPEDPFASCNNPSGGASAVCGTEARSQAPSGCYREQPGVRATVYLKK